MRAFACPITKEFFEYPENCVFKVYSRKSNSVKKLIYVGTDVNKAWKYYLSIKVFQKDYRYLMFTLPQSNDEQMIKRHQGTDLRPLNKRMSVTRKYPRIKGCSVGPLRDVSKSLVAEMKTYCKTVILGEKRLIELLLAEFLSFPVEEREQFLTDSQRFLDNYLIQDGGNLAEDYIERREELKAVREEEQKQSDTTAIDDDLL